MADYQHRAGIAADRFLQPGDAFDVQVIGRLIKQEQIGRGNERACQRHALSQTT